MARCIGAYAIKKSEKFKENVLVVRVAEWLD